MNDFTYVLPFNESKFPEIIINKLKREHKHEIAHLLKSAKLKFLLIILEFTQIILVAEDGMHMLFI